MVELGQLQDAESRVADAVSLSRERGDKAALSWATQVQGLVRSAAGDWEGAERSFEEAEAVQEEMGDRTAWAIARADHAELFIARGGPGDLERGRAMLEEALDRFEEFGMENRAEEARRRLEELES